MPKDFYWSDLQVKLFTGMSTEVSNCLVTVTDGTNRVQYECIPLCESARKKNSNSYLVDKCDDNVEKSVRRSCLVLLKIRLQTCHHHHF